MNRHRQLGISLIEILVAIAIAAVILAGVVQLFSGMKQSEQLSMSLARLQENGRFAIDILSRELRMAGFQGCSDPNQAFVPTTNVIARDFPLKDPVWSAVRGTTVANDGSISLFNGKLKIDDAVPGTDVVALGYTSILSAALSEDMGDHEDDIKLDNPVESFSRGDFILISNCSADGQYVFRVSSVVPGPPFTIKRADDYNESLDFDILFTKEDPVTTVQRIVFNTYYIKKNSRGINALYRRGLDGNSEEIIEGVDNLKLLYALYDDNDTAAAWDDYVEWVDADTLDDDWSSWSHVTGVKIAVLLSGELDVLADNGPDTYDMLGTDVSAPADKRLRRVFTTSVKIRNRDGKKISI